MMGVGRWSDVQEWMERSSKLLIKKLSRHDCSWADEPSKHQCGVCIPYEIRKSGFFPELKNLNAEKPHILESPLPTIWPTSGEAKKSNLKHSSNNGPEMHFTGVPKDEFSGLTPASVLIGGVLRQPVGDIHHWFMTIDSATEAAELLETVFDLGSDFHYGLFDSADALKVWKNDADQLIEELAAALQSDSLQSFITTASNTLAPETLVADAQRTYMAQQGIETLDPYEMPCPGDAIMKISRDIEYALYKRAEVRYRAAEVVRIVTEGGANRVLSAVRSFPKLDALFLSASQQRKKRVGRSLEHHIARILRDGRIRYEEQAITGGRRPDFVLPSVAVLTSMTRTFDEAMILSLKTTLRERWKQVPMERFRCELFLATVDDRVSSEAVDGMQAQGINLVVPESLKSSKETCYDKKPNVITFRDFFDEQISVKRAGLRY